MGALTVRRFNLPQANKLIIEQAKSTQINDALLFGFEGNAIRVTNIAEKRLVHRRARSHRTVARRTPCFTRRIHARYNRVRSVSMC